MHQCSSCGNLYDSCGHRAPTLKRDAANTFRASADSSPSAGFWGVVGLMMVLGWIVALIDRIPHQAWPIIGIGVGVVAFFVILVTALNARERHRRRQEEGEG